MTFVPNEPGFTELERASDELAAELAARVAQHARSVAPVDTGAYRDSIHVERGADGATVIADVPYAGVIELGTDDTPAFAPLHRGVDAVAAEVGP